MKNLRFLFNPSLRLACLSIVLVAPRPGAAQSEGGDQFLDGIGETALISRYVLNGNTTDRSRNNLQATLQGSGANYVEDDKFGKVLSLPGTGGAFLQLPGQVLEGADAVTVTGWVFLRSTEPWQRFFDFGLNPETNFFCTPIGDAEDEGYRARITTSGWGEEQGPTAARVATNRWVHLAVVLDAPRRTLSLYRDGTRVGQATNVTTKVEELLDDDDARRTQLYVGKSRYDTDSYLNAKLHDIRLYSVALTDQQIATIHKNAVSGEKTASATKPTPSGVESNTAAGSPFHPFELVSLPEITVETVVGTLPRLPRTVAGVYRDGVNGPALRVIWPSPTNNQQVLQPGTYTVTGRIAGTKVEPKATVTVKTATAKSPAPIRTVEGFPLDRVTLNRDEQKRPTPFIQHRDKFIQGLAKTDPDAFLYMFRDAFGQKQPENARALGGWDSQTTRLRGYAFGNFVL
jgi:hypothetical protein